MQAASMIRRRFMVPQELYCRSQTQAQAVNLPMKHYGARAIYLLNRATTDGFSTRKTSLISSNAELLALPLLAVTAETGHKQYMNVTGSVEQFERFDSYAEQAGISSHERLARSLRFANFIVANTADRTVITLQHDNAPIVLADLFQN